MSEGAESGARQWGVGGSVGGSIATARGSVGWLTVGDEMFTTEARRHGGLTEGGLSGEVIGAAIEVHRELGAGLLESVYEACLCEELRRRSVPHARQVLVPLCYKDRELEQSFRLDLLVADTLVVEVKSLEQILPVHTAQLLTYMKLSGKRVGLLLNFNVPALKDGIIRRVL